MKICFADENVCHFKAKFAITHDKNRFLIGQELLKAMQEVFIYKENGSFLKNNNTIDKCNERSSLSETHLYPAKNVNEIAQEPMEQKLLCFN